MKSRAEGTAFQLAPALLLAALLALAMLAWAGAAGASSGDDRSGASTRSDDDDDDGDDNDNKGGPGAVFGMTNSAAGNSVTAFRRDSDGRIRRVGSFPTGGMGSGVLENNATGLLLGDKTQQSPTDLGGGSRFLFAVNAGSSSITVFRRDGAQLRRVELEQSTGGNINHPISLTLYDDVLYVLNGPTSNCMGGTPTISGFRVSDSGRLTPISGSTQPVPGGAGSGCAHVTFDLEGEILIVSERGFDNLATYRVDDSGRAGPPQNNATTEIGPFGMNFTKKNVLLTAVNNGAAPNLGGTASYKVNENGMLTPLQAMATRNFRSDTCWLEITDNHKYAYTANFQTGDISSYRVGKDGRLVLMNPVAAVVNGASGAFDLALVGSRFLYDIDSNQGTIVAWRIRSDGSLVEVDRDNVGFAPGVFGLAAT